MHSKKKNLNLMTGELSICLQLEDNGDKGRP